MIKNLALASLVAASAVLAQDSSQLHIDTPNGPVACQPTRITWGGGQPPYYVTILKGGESSGTPLADLTGGTPTSETSLTWWVNLEPGTSITATIKDATGAQNSAAQVSVASGGNTDCISKPLSVSIAGAMATPSGSSNGQTPQATDGGNQQGGGAAGGNTGGDQASATPSATGGEQSQSAAPSGSNEQSQSQSAESGSASATSASQSGSASPSASSAGNAASSGSSGAADAGSKATSATSAAGGAASSPAAGGNSGASALVPGFVAPALAAVVAAFAL